LSAPIRAEIAASFRVWSQNRNFVLPEVKADFMAVETIGEAYSLGWCLSVRCIRGREDNTHRKSSRACDNR
jgi:hypothetical protein